MKTNEKLNLTMLCDFYELTMGNGYFVDGKADQICYFDVFFRNVPDGGGFAIAAGLEQVVEYIRDLHFSEDDLAYRRGLRKSLRRGALTVRAGDVEAHEHLVGRHERKVCARAERQEPNDRVLRASRPHAAATDRASHERKVRAKGDVCPARLGKPLRELLEKRCLRSSGYDLDALGKRRDGDLDA